jgi:L-threonylcarbamoyladenylate synthase
MPVPPTREISIEETKDAALVCALTLSAWSAYVDPRSSGHRLTESDVEEHFNAGILALVALDETGTPVGSVLAGPGHPESWDLMKLAVPPPPGQDVGGALVRAVLDRARSSGISSVSLAVSRLQPELCRYYARFGFVVEPDGVYLHNSPFALRPPIVMVRDLKPRPNAIKPIDLVANAVRALADGNLVALPTETVYGLGALASDPIAVRRVFATKGRPVDHPLIVHLASANALDTWAVEVPEHARILAATFWPGPLTMVLKRSAIVPDEVTGGRATVALRVPDHPLTLAVLGSLPRNSGVAAPSANQFGRVSPTTAAHVREDIASLLLPGDLILDGGASAVGVESTIIDLSGDRPTILRPGGLAVERIEEVLGIAVDRIATGPSRAPGMLDVHYAPLAGVRMVALEQLNTLTDVFESLLAEGKRVGALLPVSTPLPELVVRLDAPDPYVGESLAPILYARLRNADELGLDVLVVVSPASDGLGWAVTDRLQRSAAASHPPRSKRE